MKIRVKFVSLAHRKLLTAGKVYTVVESRRNKWGYILDDQGNPFKVFYNATSGVDGWEFEKVEE